MKTNTRRLFVFVASSLSVPGLADNAPDREDALINGQSSFNALPWSHRAMSHDPTRAGVSEGDGLHFAMLDQAEVGAGSENSGGPESAVARLQSDKSDGSGQAQRKSGAGARRQARGIEEVVVTAQKQEERLVDTPISIGVLSGETLDRGSSRGVTDFLNQIGGVSVTQGQPGSATIAVRGVVAPVGSSTIAYYLDEVPFGYNRSATLADSGSFDLARVEVLRGPQGTLYGANSLSGVVRILTNEADLDTFELKGRTRVSSTDRGAENYDGDIVINLPIVQEKLAIRAMASYSDASGYIDSTFDGHEQINSSTIQDYRLKLNWQAAENLGIRFGYWRSKIENDAPSLATETYTTPFSSNQPDERVLNIYSLVAELRTSAISLLSSTGYVDYSTDSRTELLLGATSALGVFVQAPMTTFSQEVRLDSQWEGPWHWSAGAMYKDTKERNIQAAPPAFPGAVGFPGIFEQGSISESYAAFTELARSFDDARFEIAAGLRYFRDKETIEDISDLLPTTRLVPNQSADFDQVTGRLVFTYKPEDDSTLYASVATGFRSGAIQSPSVVRIDPTFDALDPDKLTNYEVGAKGTFDGGKFGYDLAIYYMDWKDIQQSLVLPIGFTARVNAGRAKGFGVDTSVVYQPTSALTLGASVGWNDLRFSETTLSQGLVLFAKDDRPNGSAEWTGSVNGNYRVATAKPGLDVVLSSSFAYGSLRPLRFLSARVLRETESDELRQWRASIGLASERWSIDIFGDNLLNDASAITAPDINVANTAIRQRPRTVGLQVSFDY